MARFVAYCQCGVAICEGGETCTFLNVGAECAAPTGKKLNHITKYNIK